MIGGFLLSVAVVLISEWFVDREAWAAWGWRIPFLFSIVLLAVSLWVRLKLKESPVFQAMKEAGETARNPITESFRGRHQLKMVLVALFGVAAGLTVIWYTAQFQALYFLQNALRIDDTAARAMIGAAALVSMFWFVLFGWLSDRIGRKPLIVTGYALTIVLLFPLVPLDGGGGQSAAGGGDGAQSGDGAGRRLRLQSVRAGAGDALRPGAGRADLARHRLRDAAGAGLERAGPIRCGSAMRW